MSNHKEKLPKAPSAPKKKRRLHGLGEHRQHIDRICRARPGDLKGQIATYLGKVELPAGTGTIRRVAEDTKTAWGNTLLSLPDALTQTNLRIRDIKDLRRVHVTGLIRYWIQENVSGGTIANRISILRRFLVLMGKPGVIPAGVAWSQILREEGIDPARVRRSRKQAPKAWTDNGVDPIEHIERAKRDCIIFGTILETKHALGLRGKEGFCTPFTANDLGHAVVVHAGAKGGRRREVSLSTDPERLAYQRDVIERAKEVAATHGENRLLKKPGLSLRQMESYYRNRARKNGFTKKALGVVPHGLRHEYVANEQEEATGMPPPSSERVPADYYFENEELQRKVELEVSEKVGHGRPVLVYGGSRHKHLSVTKRRLAARLEALSATGKLFEEAGAERAWLIGLAAEGLEMRRGRVMEIAVRFTCSLLRPEEAAQLAHRLTEAAKEPVAILGWLGAEVPPAGREINFRRNPHSNDDQP
jgi:site-specific recombinase XerC